MPKKILTKNIEKIQSRTLKTANREVKYAAKKLGVNTPDEFLNTSILSELGVTIENEKGDYSLKTIANDQEFIKNPKIVEKDSYNRIENKYDKPDDKFNNEDDPFYELDEQVDNFVPKPKKLKTREATKIQIIRKLTYNRGLKQL